MRPAQLRRQIWVLIFPTQNPYKWSADTPPVKYYRYATRDRRRNGCFPKNWWGQIFGKDKRVLDVPRSCVGRSVSECEDSIRIGRDNYRSSRERRGGLWLGEA